MTVRRKKKKKKKKEKKKSSASGVSSASIHNVEERHTFKNHQPCRHWFGALVASNLVISVALKYLMFVSNVLANLCLALRL